jgi:hypothetical protein
VLRQLEGLAPRDYADYYNIAIIHLALGQKDEAFGALEHAYQQRSASVAFLRADPFWVDLLPEARFRDLLHRVGLPEQ